MSDVGGPGRTGTSNRVEFLAESSTLQGLPRGVLRVIADAMAERTFAPGEHLMRQGGPGDCMLVVRAGAAQVSVTDARGTERVLAMAGPGSVLGEMALLTKEPRSADVVAVGEVVTLLLDAEHFNDLVRTYPDIAVVLTHLVAERLGHAPRDALGGKVLGGFRIRRRLGIGATAVVYRAERVATGELVALKMLSHRLAFDDVAIRRFHRELSIVERLRHPNVARVYERFEAFATYFMAMEFCDGRNVAEVIAASGRLPEPEVRALVGQVARALSHVHAHDVVHKDLKPANVMLNTDGTAKLMDFGIARPPADLTQDADVERFFAGTPRYMAPEQFRMAECERSVDLYALGCLAYEALTGTQPFKVETFADLVRVKLSGELPPLREHCPDLSAEMESFVRTALAVRPESRRLDMDALSEWAAPIDPALVARAAE